MHAIAVANCLSSNLLSPRVMLGLTSPTVKYPNFRACQLPSSLIPQVLLKRKETLRSPSNICSPIHRPVFSCFTCLSWPTAGLTPRQGGFAAQAGRMAEPVIPCGGCCRMRPSPCAPADLHPLACRSPTTGLRHTIPQVGTPSPHSWKVSKKRLLGNLRGFIHLHPSGCGVDY